MNEPGGQEVFFLNTKGEGAKKRRGFHRGIR